MKWYWWVLIVILAYGVLTDVYSLDNFMDNPVDNAISSAEKALDKAFEILNINNPLSSIDGKTNYGKPDCVDNSSCNILGQCNDNCECISGECYG